MGAVRVTSQVFHMRTRSGLLHVLVLASVCLTPPLGTAFGLPAYAQGASPRMAATPLEGSWLIVLSDAMKRSLTIMRIGLQLPPATEDEMLRARLTAEERLQVVAVAQLLAANPNSDEVLKMRASVQYFPATRMTFSGDSRTAFMGPIQTHDDRFRIVSIEGARVIVDATPNGMAPFDGVWAPTREEYILVDENTLIAVDGASDRHITFRRVAPSDNSQ